MRQDDRDDGEAWSASGCACPTGNGPTRATCPARSSATCTPYKVALTVRKEGDRLIYTNRGTDPSVGSFNITAGVLRACITNSLLTFLCYDQYLCAAGLLEQVDFDFERGTITSANHPAAVSTSIGLVVALVQAQHLNMKMLSTTRGTAHQTFGASGVRDADLQPHVRHRPVRQPDRELPARRHRRRARGVPLARRARARRDDELDDEPGRQRRVDRARDPDALPVPARGTDSGGHGRWRGGACLVSAMVGHRSPEHYISSGGLAQSVTQGIGVLGGWPATGGTMWRAEDCAIREWLADGRLPRTPEQLREMAPDGGLAPPKVFDNRLLERRVRGAARTRARATATRCCASPSWWPRTCARARRSVAGRRAHLRRRARRRRGVDGRDRGAPPRAAAQRLAEPRPPREPRAGTLLGRSSGRALATVAYAPTATPRWAARTAGASSRRGAGTTGSASSSLELPMTELGAHFIDPREQIGHELRLARVPVPGLRRGARRQSVPPR